MRKRILIAACGLLFSLMAIGQTTTTYTGTIKDLSQAVVTSGQVTFTLQPSSDTTISGVARFVPLTVTCTINGSGLVKALDGVSACVVTNNTSLTPSGTSYKACIQAYNVTPGSCFNVYALGTSTDITTVVPTPGTAPAYTFVDTMSNQTIAGNKTFTGNSLFSGSTSFSGAVSALLSLNGTCVVSSSQTLQACINSFPSGSGDILIPCGTYSSVSGALATISGNAQSRIRLLGGGMGCTVLQYTGGSVIPAVVDIGTASPTVNILHGIVMRDMTIRSTGNATHGVRWQGVDTSDMLDVAVRDMAGSAFQCLFCVGEKIIGYTTSPNDGGGAFSTVPTIGIEWGELGANFGSTTSSIVTPRIEGVSGCAIQMRNAFDNAVSAGQITTNGCAFDVANGSGASLNNSWTSTLGENSSNTDGLSIASRNFSFYSSQIGTTGTGKVHFKAGGDNASIHNGQAGTAGITIDAGVTNTHLTQLMMDPTKLTNNGKSTILDNNFNPLTGKQWMNAQPTFRQILPDFAVGDGLVGGAGFDSMDHPVQSCWDLSTTPRVLSDTVMTTGKPWRAMIHGYFQNNTDGGGLAQITENYEITSVLPTITVGTITATFSVNGSGQLSAVTGASNVGLCGSIDFYPNPSGAAGTVSAIYKDVVQSRGALIQDTTFSTNPLQLKLQRNTTQGDYVGIGFLDSTSTTEESSVRHVRDSTESTFALDFLTTPFGGGEVKGFEIVGGTAATAPYARWNRSQCNLGTSLTTAAITALSAGWGTTPSVTSVTGFDSCFTAVISSGTATGLAANPTATFTFVNGVWPNIPVCVASRGDVNAPIAGTWTLSAVSTTAFTINFIGTPIASTAYTMNVICTGK